MLTYRELQAILNQASPEQLDATVTVYMAEQDEFYGVTNLEVSAAETCDVLDDNHIFLKVSIS
jgi:hypothetical protein